MSLPNPIKLIGANGSPYTRKMLSFLRYKRIPYTMIWSDVDTYFSKAKFSHNPCNLISYLLFPYLSWITYYIPH